MKKSTIVTKKQSKVLDLIKQYLKTNSQSPTIEELRQLLGVSSSRTIGQHLDALEKKGFIARERGQRRNIKILDSNTVQDSLIKIPVLGVTGCDSQNIFADKTYNEFISVDKDLFESGKEIFSVKAIGNSMVDAGIPNGSYVIFEKSENDIQNGDRVVAIIGDMAVIKRVQFTDRAVALYPDSSEERFEPILLKDNYNILGKVIDVVKAVPQTEEIVYDYQIEH